METILVTKILNLDTWYIICMVTSAVTRLTTTWYIHLYGYKCGYKADY